MYTVFERASACSVSYRSWPSYPRYDTNVCVRRKLSLYTCLIQFEVKRAHVLRW